MNKVISIGLAGLSFLFSPLDAAEMVAKTRPFSNRSSVKVGPRKLAITHGRIIQEGKEFEQEMSNYIKDFDQSIQDYEKLATKYPKGDRDYTILAHLFDLRSMVSSHYSCFRQLLDIAQSNRSLGKKKIEERRKFIRENVNNVRTLDNIIRLSRDKISEHDRIRYIVLKTNNPKMALMEYAFLEIIKKRRQASHE